MNKKLIKIFSVLLMVIMLCSISLNVFAAITPSSITATESVTGETQLQNVGQDIVGILRTVGIILSVVILIILGIKYMMGSAEEKADYKKSMMPYIIGAALIFAASAFAEVIFQFFNNITTK